MASLTVDGVIQNPIFGSLRFEPLATNRRRTLTLKGLSLAQVEAIAREATELAKDMKRAGA